MHGHRMRVWWFAFLAALLWWGGSSASASAQENNGLTVPAAGAEVSGTIAIDGVAAHPTFRKWQLDILPNGDEQQANFVALGEVSVPAPAELVQFDTSRLANGAYTLRLRVVHSNLNYDETFTPIVIHNIGASSLPVSASAAVNAPTDAAMQPAAPTEAVVQFRTDAPADGKRWIEIDISDQSLTAWQGDVPIFQTTVSTGKPGWRTLPGEFKVYRKYEATRMTGPDYDTPDVPWTMYYFRGFAIHGAYWHNNFGTPVSHGCVNLRVPEAKALYEWAAEGTEVVVNQ